MERLTMTDSEMEEIRMMFLEDYDCPIKAEPGTTTNRFCDRVCDEFQDDCPFAKVGLKLKAYEDAEENGMLKMLPCRIDDEMWAIRQYRGVLNVQKGFVSEMFFTKEMKLMIVVKHVARGVFGEKVFLTREEAEQALAKMEGEN